MKLGKLQIIAAICLVVGLGIFMTGFGMLGYDPMKLSTEAPYEVKSYVASGPVRAINIDDNNADIEIAPSADDKVHISYGENNHAYYDIKESPDGSLTIKSMSHRQWYDYLVVIDLQQPKLLVEIPADDDNNIAVRARDGSILVRDISAKDLLLSSADDDIQIRNVSLSGQLEANESDDNIYISGTTVIGDIVCHTSDGKIDLDTVSGRSLEAKSADGKIALKSVTAGETVDLKAANGDIQLDTVQFGEEMTCIALDGSVKGTLAGALSDYSVACQVYDGKSNLPENMNGGDKRLTIKATDGDVNIDFSD